MQLENRDDLRELCPVDIRSFIENNEGIQENQQMVSDNK